MKFYKHQGIKAFYWTLFGMTFWVRILIKILRANNAFISNDNKTRVMKTKKIFAAIIFIIFVIATNSKGALKKVKF